MFFPAEPNPTPESMNWSILIYGVVVIFAPVAFGVRKRFTYEGPVKYVRNEEFEDVKIHDP